MLSSQLYAAFCALFIPPFYFCVVDAQASVDFDNGMFKLQWTHDDGKLVFNMTCKTIGWCGVGFAQTSDGKGMVNYDMAVGGVDSNSALYLDGYQSTGPGIPTRDPTPDYRLIKASEENGYTNIQFERIDTTEGDDKDVQFTSNSEVWIVRAWQNNYDAPLGLDNSTLQHSHTGVSTKKYNLIKEATANGMKTRVTTYTILSLIVFTYLL